MLLHKTFLWCLLLFTIPSVGEAKSLGEWMQFIRYEAKELDDKLGYQVDLLYANFLEKLFGCVIFGGRFYDLFSEYEIKAEKKDHIHYPFCHDCAYRSWNRSPIELIEVEATCDLSSPRYYEVHKVSNQNREQAIRQLQFVS